MVPAALSVAERLVSGVVVVAPVEPGGGGLGWGIVTGNRGVWSREARRPPEQREEPAVAVDEELLDDAEDRRRDPVDEEARRQEPAVDEREGRQQQEDALLGARTCGSSDGVAIIRVWMSWRIADASASSDSPNRPGRTFQEDLRQVGRQAARVARELEAGRR